MAAVELRPGDVLNVVWSSVQNTPLGRKEVESSFSYSYDELLIQLKTKGRRGRAAQQWHGGGTLQSSGGVDGQCYQEGHVVNGSKDRSRCRL